MDEDHCPGFNECRLVNKTGFAGNENLRKLYLNNYCTSVTQQWKSCKRYETKQLLHFCPDFILPDTSLSMDEILNKIETEL